MKNYINRPDDKVTTVVVSHEASHLVFRVNARIAYLIWSENEPQRHAWEKGSFVYYEDRPRETFVIYILNKIMFEFLAKFYNKEMKWLHIHECVNTKWDIICWPEKVSSEEEAIEVLKKWSGMIWALLISLDIWDINDFFEKYKENDGDWWENAVKKSWVKVDMDERIT